MKTLKLKAMPYAQAHVEYKDENNYCLYSYSTRVCEVVDGKLKVNGLYSMTTRKHISAFMREYLNMTFQDAKQLYIGRLEMDIATGEVLQVA